MAKARKKTEAELLAVQGIANHNFEGGPRDGTQLRMILKPRPFIRFGYPVWCTYRWDPTRKAYVYWGEGPPPKQEDDRAGPTIVPRADPPATAAQLEHLESLRRTEAYRRGVALAEENLKGLP